MQNISAKLGETLAGILIPTIFCSGFSIGSSFIKSCIV